nr:myomodulin isoform, GLQMLRL amide [Lymnaea stagnalis, penis complex, Peptide, 7 aa] [Lymnaea stagnalis]AAB47025.1 myomodulin, MME=peptide cotransmitter [Aplysia californica=mollusk, B16 accessory radula closer (ARC) muscle, Peptide, 7 aa] [Aplysia californica]
GLQMLRL